MTKPLDLRAQALRSSAGVRMQAMKFVCQACGRVLVPGEGSRVCPDCGSRDVRLVPDEGRYIEMKCAS
ncbi:MAG: hypothetical protein Q4C41_02885 [Eggerthellaceae bacterium]|nr:hypothetical protein [Eggerthellaceae bacterium]